MALVAAVTKKEVTRDIVNVYNITMNMVLTDDSVEVIDRDYSIRYRSGDEVGGKISQLITQMQADIDRYKAEQTIFNAAALDTAVTTIQNGIVV